MSSLKQLPGRKSFFSELKSKIKTSDKNKSMLGVLIFRLSRFRELNEKFGHEYADKVLEHVYNRIKKELHNKDCIERIGDREFGVILNDSKGSGQNIFFASQLIQIFDDPIILEGNQFRIKMAVGMVSYPEHADDLVGIMKCANYAVNQARDTRERYFHFNDDDDYDPTTLFVMESDLEKAIENDQIEAYYQPKVDLTNMSIYGFEVLSRWNNKSKGFIRPDLFIDLAEKSGLITAMTVKSISQTLRQIKELPKPASHDNYTLSLNLSAEILNDPENTEIIFNTVSIWCDEPSLLVLEVTEGSMMTDPESSRKTLEKLHGSGVKISIDDFGTGYSSLSYLKKLPVDELKIDQSFVFELLDNDDDIRIVKTVIDLAHNFDLIAVAEGVENEETLIKLKNLGCELAQGYYIAKPMPFEELLPWIQNWEASHSL